jgi:hypothetical protein
MLLHCWNDRVHTSLNYSLRWGLGNFLSGLASNHDPPNLCLSSSLDYKRKPPIPGHLSLYHKHPVKFFCFCEWAKWMLFTPVNGSRSTLSLCLVAPSLAPGRTALGQPCYFGHFLIILRTLHLEEPLLCTPHSSPRRACSCHDCSRQSTGKQLYNNWMNFSCPCSILAQGVRGSTCLGNSPRSQWLVELEAVLWLVQIKSLICMPKPCDITSWLCCPCSCHISLNETFL